MCQGAPRAVESRVVMAGLMTREPVGREIIRAGLAVAAVRDAAAGRRTRALQRGPVGRQSGSRSWRPSIQNVQVGIIEREQAWLLDGGPYGPVRIEVVLRHPAGIDLAPGDEMVVRALTRFRPPRARGLVREAAIGRRPGTV